MSRLDRPPAAARVLAFGLVFLALLVGYVALPGAERFVIERLTVQAAAGLLDVWDATLGVQARGAELVAPGGGLRVLEGCEGTDVALLLTSAMITAPLAWRRRLAGAAAGLMFVWLLNQARVVTLFYAWRHDRVLFEALHGLVLPVVLVLAAGLFFVAWLACCDRASPRV